MYHKYNFNFNMDKPNQSDILQIFQYKYWGVLVQWYHVQLQMERSMVLILPWPNMNFSWHKKWRISGASLNQGVNLYPERVVSVQVWYYWASYAPPCIISGTSLQFSFLYFGLVALEGLLLEFSSEWNH